MLKKIHETKDICLVLFDGAYCYIKFLGIRGIFRKSLNLVAHQSHQEEVGDNVEKAFKKLVNKALGQIGYLL